MSWIKNIFSKMIEPEKVSETINATNTLITGKGTTRLGYDMMSDSWLSANIRPLMAIFTFLLVIFVLVFPEFSDDDIKLVIFGLFGDIIKFYFVGRTTEKVIKMLINKYK